MVLKVNQSVEFDAKYASAAWDMESIEFSKGGDKVVVNLPQVTITNLAMNIINKVLSDSNERFKPLPYSELEKLRNDITSHLESRTKTVE